MNRRDALKKTALSTVGIGSLPSIGMLLQSCSVTEQAYVPVNLSAEQYETIWHLAETILPKTTTPGASDAKVAPYIDLLFSGYLEVDDSNKLKKGLNDFMLDCQSKFQANFDAITIENRISFLEEIEEEANPKSFYASIRGIILWAFFTSEVGIKSMNYRPVPGQYNGCIEADNTTLNLIGNRW